MLKLTRYSGDEVFVNPELIKSVERGADTLVTLINGEKLLVRESAESICASFIAYKRSLYARDLPEVLPST